MAQSWNFKLGGNKPVADKITNNLLLSLNIKILACFSLYLELAAFVSCYLPIQLKTVYDSYILL